jgi:hypothetical protein
LFCFVSFFLFLMEFPLPSFLPSFLLWSSKFHRSGWWCLIRPSTCISDPKPIAWKFVWGVHSTFYDLVLGFVILAKTGGGGGFVCWGTRLVDMWFLRDFSRWWFQSSEYCV